MIAVILAGGEGKRLRPYTYILPKPLLPIGDKPILDLLLEKLKKQEIDEIILAVNFKAKLFEILYGNGSERDMKISYLKEDKPLGTAGPLKKLEGKVTEDFFVMNGDIISDLDIRKAEEFHKKTLADMTIVTKKIETPIDYGVLKIENMEVLEWKEKPKIKSEISMGMYFLNPKVLRYIPQNEFFNMPDLALSIIKNKGKIFRFLYEGEMIDLGNIEEYENVQKKISLGNN